MRTEVVSNPDGPGVIVARFADWEAMKDVADVCKKLHNEGLHGSSEMRVLGHYPPGVIEIYCKRNGISFAEFMRNAEHANNIMRDPALAYFRVHKGAV